jgi:hypothetical protein
MQQTTFIILLFVDPITKFQKQRTIISIKNFKNQNQRTPNSYRFKTLVEPTIIFILFFMKIRVLNQKTGSFKKIFFFKSEKSSGTFRTAMITVGGSTVQFLIPAHHGTKNSLWPRSSECIYSFASLHATPEFNSSFCPTLISFFQPCQNIC